AAWVGEQGLGQFQVRMQLSLASALVLRIVATFGTAWEIVQSRRNRSDLSPWNATRRPLPALTRPRSRPSVPTDRLLAATRQQPLQGTSALGSLQAFAWNVSPHGDHRMGPLEDHAERLRRGPSILSWMLPLGTSSRMGKVARPRGGTADFDAAASCRWSTLLPGARVARRGAGGRQTPIQRLAVERLAPAPDPAHPPPQPAHPPPPH